MARPLEFIVRFAAHFLPRYIGIHHKKVTDVVPRIFIRSLSSDAFQNNIEGDKKRVCDIIFEMFQESEDEMPLISMQNALLGHGVRWKTDPRLGFFRNKLVEWKEEKNLDKISTSHCNRSDLYRLLDDDKCLAVLAKTLGHQCIIPNFEYFKTKIEVIYDNLKDDQSGSLATYIPQLAKEDPTRFGLSLCTIDGQRMDIGDAEVPFCLQSCIKPIQYAVAVTTHTSRYVHTHIGREPSGNFFNAIMLNTEDQPHNPMINAGALVVCAVMKPELPVAERFVHVQSIISEMAAGEYTSFHNAVFQSERATSFRNFALAYLLKEKNCFPHGASVEETVDLYLQLCALKMTCSSASVAAASLANGGVSPLAPEKRILDPTAVRNTLSLMHSCGMYDYSGVFAFHVGLPAKSGVAGGLMLVVPNVMGVMIWSPLLDERGNSVRGLRFCKDFVRHFNFHAYDNLRYSERKSDPRLLKTPLNGLEKELASISKHLCGTEFQDL